MTQEDIFRLIKKVQVLEKSKEVKRSSQDLTGPVVGCYKLGYNDTTGKLFYRDENNLWQPVPTSTGNSSSNNTYSYSTTENLTNSSWINNKPTYRVVFTGTTNNQYIDVSNLDIEKVISINGSFTVGQGGNILPIGTFSQKSTRYPFREDVNIAHLIDDNGLKLEIKSYVKDVNVDFNAQSLTFVTLLSGFTEYNIVLEYTKNI